MKILMAASGDFALPTCRALSTAGHDIVGLITQPDRPAGRGRKLRPAPVKAVAVEGDVPIWQPERIDTDEMVETVAEIGADALLVVAYGQKIPEAICELPPCGAMNLHGSMLPELRGAAPANWAIIRGFQRTGVTVQYLAQRMDAGDILAQHELAVGRRETAPELYGRLARAGADLVVEVLDRIGEGTQTSVPQDESRATHAPRLRKEDGMLDWSRSAAEIDCRVRGLKPWPRAFTFLLPDGGEPLRVIVEEVEPLAGDAPSDAEPGRVVEAGHDLVVAAGEGLVRLVRLKPAGSKAMTAEAFCNGHAVSEGARLGTPARSRDGV